ncbi:phage integrase family protein [Burkholderia gladioli]
MLGELIAFCNAHGGSWWRAVPRIGAGRARHLVAWLRRHAPTIGLTVNANVDARDPLEAPTGQLIEVGRAGTLAPLERTAVPHPLPGAAGTPAATSRAALFPYIAAPHDLVAVRAYLYQYRYQPKTLRAYTKELERFVPWAGTVHACRSAACWWMTARPTRTFCRRRRPASSAPGRRATRRAGARSPTAN